MDIQDAFVSGNIVAIRRSHREILTQIGELTKGVEDDIYNDEILELQDMITYRAVFGAAVEGYRKTEDFNIMSYLLNHFLMDEADYLYTLETLLYDNKDGFMNDFIGYFSHGCRLGVLSEALAIACELGDLTNIECFMKRGAENEYAVQTFFGLNDVPIDRKEFYNIIRKINKYKHIFPLIRLIGKKHPIFYNIGLDFTGRELDVVLNHFIDRSTINNMRLLVRDLVSLNYNYIWN